MSLEIVFAPGTANESRVDLSKDGTRLTPVRTHTGVSDVRGTIKADRSLEAHAKRQDRMNILSDGNVIWTGFCVGVSHNKANATTEIQGDGIGKRLEETRPDYDSIGGPVTYQNTPLQDAIRDYWGRTPFDNVTVTGQDTELVAEDALVQDADTTSEWENRFSVSDDDPFRIENDAVEILQTNWVFEGEESLSSGILTVGPDDAYSGGEARGILGDNVSVGDYFEVTFTPQYDVPRLYLNWREDGNPGPNDADGEVTIPGIEITANSTEIFSYTDGGTRTIDSVGWQNVQPIADNTFSAGEQVTVRVEVTSASQSDYGDWIWDVISVYDNRYSYNFDNTLHEAQGYLDGPELYPNGVSLETDTVTTSYNVSASRLNTTWNDTGGAQAIAVSNDGGSTYESASNTDTIDTPHSNPGREVRAKFTLGGYGTRDTATPRTGFNGHEISLYEHYVDGDDLVVIESIELSRNHFDNLQTLHSYGDFLWVIEHTDQDIADMPVHSFRRGDEQRPKPDGFDKQKNQKPAIQSGVYFNSIYLEGAKQSDGTRPTAEVKDQDAINEDGREISPGVLRDLTINTDAGAQFRAQALLDAAQSNNDLVGTVTVMPMMTHPGYARPVDFGNGETNKTVEEISLNISQGSADASFDFTSRTGLVDDLDTLKRNARDQGNQV